jgi:hypothetical protein
VRIELIPLEVCSSCSSKEGAQNAFDGRKLKLSRRKGRVIRKWEILILDFKRA